MATPKRKPQDKNPAPKTSLAAKARKRRTRTTAAKAVREVASNPPIVADLTHVLLPGFLAYGATRVLQRIAFTLVQKRWPRFGKWAHAAAGVASFTGAWFLAHRIKKLAPFHDGILMGTGIAGIQGVASAVLPTKYNWLLADCRPEDVTPAPAKESTNNTVTASLPAAAAGDEYSYLEEQMDELESSGSRRARTIPPPKSTNKPVAKTMAMAADDDGGDLDPDLLDELEDGEDVDDFYSGAFATN